MEHRYIPQSEEPTTTTTSTTLLHRSNIINAINNDYIKIFSILNLITSFVIMCMIIAIVTYTSPLLHNSNELLSSGSQTINDLNTIIPKVNQSLVILENVCKQYPEYCKLTNFTSLS